MMGRRSALNKQLHVVSDVHIASPPSQREESQFGRRTDRPTSLSSHALMMLLFCTRPASSRHRKAQLRNHHEQPPATTKFRRPCTLHIICKLRGCATSPNPLICKAALSIQLHRNSAVSSLCPDEALVEVDEDTAIQSLETADSLISNPLLSRIRCHQRGRRQT